jgi:hypothetical protein
MKKHIAFAFIALALAFAACEGPTGPQGAAGPEGAGGNPIPGTLTLSGAPMVGGSITPLYDNPGKASEVFYYWHAGDDSPLGGVLMGRGAGGSRFSPQAADTGKTLTCRVYAMGYTGYLESAPVIITPFAAPAAPTALTTGYVTGTLTAVTDIHWYSFNVSGGSCTVEWEDNGTGSTTGSTVVSAYQSDGTPLFQNAYSMFGVGSSTPFSGYTGTVYVKVVPGSTDGTYLGTYHIKYQ